MRAYICDACGEVYRPYFALNGYGEGNMLTLVKVERDGKMHGKMRLELCPDCMIKVHDFIANDLVQENSPADEKYYEGKQEEAAPAEESKNPEPTEDDPYEIS